MDSTNSLHHTFLGIYGAKQAPAHDEESRIAAAGRGEDNVASLHGHVHSPDFRIDPFCSSPGLRGGARPMTLVPGNDFSKIVVKWTTLSEEEASFARRLVRHKLGSTWVRTTLPLPSRGEGGEQQQRWSQGSGVGFNPGGTQVQTWVELGSNSG